MGLLDKFIKQEDLFWKCTSREEPLVFWGCGNNARIVSKILKKEGIVPSAYCDNDSGLIGSYIDGIEILSYEQVKKRYSKYRIVLTVAINNAVLIMEQLKKAEEKNEILHMEKPFKVDDEMLSHTYVEENISDFENVYNWLTDEKSKEIFVNCINFKLSGNKVDLIKHIDG